MLPNMQALFFTFFVIGIVRVTECAQNCDHLGTIVYEDIGCKAVYIDGNKCPVKYDCEDFSMNNDTCVFRGKKYNVEEEIDENLTFENCYAACRCEDPTSEEKYLCAVLDCPEWSDSEPESGCHRTYDLDQCCATGVACPEKEKVEKCEYDGKVYQEGELFFPENTCIKCSCQKGFQGRLEEPFCKRNLCSLQILHSGKLQKNCAPLYFHYSAEGTLCCPNEWVCPAENENIVKLNQVAEANPDLTCKFGSNSLKLGEGFEKSVEFYGRDRNVTCECVLPPLLTCREN